MSISGPLAYIVVGLILLGLSGVIIFWAGSTNGPNCPEGPRGSCPGALRTDSFYFGILLAMIGLPTLVSGLLRFRSARVPLIEGTTIDNATPLVAPGATYIYRRPPPPRQ